MPTKTAAKLESDYQSMLIIELRHRFPGCFVLKNDSGYLQGIPDLLVLYKGKWAMLEVKAYEGAPEQPNQDFYIDLFGQMAFAAFIYPENEEEVLNDLQHSFEPGWSARHVWR